MGVFLYLTLRIFYLLNVAFLFWLMSSSFIIVCIYYKNNTEMKRMASLDRLGNGHFYRGCLHCRF